MLPLAISIPQPGFELAPPSAKTLELLSDLHEWTLQFEQTPIATEHLFHAGMYARTIRLEPETLLNGSFIKLATLLIIHGHCLMTAGDEVVELDGYNVIPGSAGRKQSFVTKGKVEMTMIFPTSVKDLEQVESEVFGEADELMSRKSGNSNSVTVTGESNDGR
jgi:hypothetical protein